MMYLCHSSHYMLGKISMWISKTDLKKGTRRLSEAQSGPDSSGSSPSGLANNASKLLIASQHRSLVTRAGRDALPNSEGNHHTHTGVSLRLGLPAHPATSSPVSRSANQHAQFFKGIFSPETNFIRELSDELWPSHCWAPGCGHFLACRHLFMALSITVTHGMTSHEPCTGICDSHLSGTIKA